MLRKNPDGIYQFNLNPWIPEETGYSFWLAFTHEAILKDTDQPSVIQDRIPRDAAQERQELDVERSRDLLLLRGWG